MRVTLVCKAELEGCTVGREYPFTFQSLSRRRAGLDGYIVEDDGCFHHLTLPSNCHRRKEGEWMSSDYFSEVVHDPEN